MKKIGPRMVLPITLVLTTLCAGCSTEEPLKNPPEKKMRTFSAEEMKQARALSITQASSVTDAANPYAKALLCKIGMDLVAQRLQNVGVMNAEQRQILQESKAYFDRQLNALGEQRGKSARDIQRDLAQVAEHHSDAAENTRTAVACLKRLQPG
jgi:hypothetical protein